MRILRYLTRDILTHTLAVSFVLFLVVFAGRFIRYLAEAAVGSLTGDVLLPIMLFKLPGFLEMILPLVCSLAFCSVSVAYMQTVKWLC